VIQFAAIFIELFVKICHWKFCKFRIWRL